MKRKDYQRPTTQIVKLQHQPHLLSGSNGDGQLQNYENWHNVDEE